MTRIALRVMVLAAAAFTSGCLYHPYGHGSPYAYRDAYSAYAYRPAPVIVYPGYRY